MPFWSILSTEYLDLPSLRLDLYNMQWFHLHVLFDLCTVASIISYICLINFKHKRDIKLDFNFSQFTGLHMYINWSSNQLNAAIKYHSNLLVFLCNIPTYFSNPFIIINLFWICITILNTTNDSLALNTVHNLI